MSDAPKNHKQPWTDRERNEVRELWSLMTANEIGRLLGRTKLAIGMEARRLNLDCGARGGSTSDGRMWTVKEERLLSQMWHDGIRVRTIAERLERSVTAIHVARYRLGLPQRLRKVSRREFVFIQERAKQGKTFLEIASEAADAGFPPRSKKVMHLIAKWRGVSNGVRRGNSSRGKLGRDMWGGT